MKRPTDISPGALEKAALHYLERYAASAETLRRMLLRRIERAVRAGAIDRAEGRTTVDAVVAKMLARRLIDDRLFAESRAARLSRQGRSSAVIQRSLAAKGVGREDIGKAMDALRESGETDLAAALRLARKRRLGPFRSAKERAARRDRDLAMLARAGYPLALARRVVDAEDIAELESEIADGA